MHTAPQRSYLFVPGHQPQRFDKACAAGASVVIIDLEDAVAPIDKEAARRAIVSWLSAHKSVLIRINAADTEWFQHDLALCRLPGVAGIVLPKAEQVDDIARVVNAGAAMVLPLIESATGFANLLLLAKAPAVQRLIFGSIDFQLDMGIDGDGEELLYFRSQLVLMSRVAGILPPVDGVTVALHDTDQLRLDTMRARRLGFGAKLCIHPKQVETVNFYFAPSKDNIMWATTVIAASLRSGGAAVAVNGDMVDRPVLQRAQAILAEAASLNNSAESASPKN